MKKIILLLLVFFTTAFVAEAQAIDVITGLNNPNRLMINGNDLYFTDANSILKIDITESDPTPEVIIGGLTSPTGLALAGNELYVAEFNAGRISKIDISLTDPVREDFVTGLNTPNFLLIDGNYLYYSDNNSDVVARFDITSGSPTAETVAQSTVNFKPTGLAMHGDILYMAQGIADRVSSVDVTSGILEPELVVAGLNRPLGIKIVGGNLFIAEFIDNLISEYTLNGSPPTLTDIVTNLSSPRDIAFSDTGDLFIIEGGANKISKVENVLQTPDMPKEKIVLFPNPASDFIKIKGIQDSLPYKIYMVSGQEVLSGDVTPLGNIDIAGLKSGTYIIAVEGTPAIRFVKH